jgi:hypothetical protein
LSNTHTPRRLGNDLVQNYKGRINVQLLHLRVESVEHTKQIHDLVVGCLLPSHHPRRQRYVICTTSPSRTELAWDTFLAIIGKLLFGYPDAMLYPSSLLMRSRTIAQLLRLHTRCADCADMHSRTATLCAAADANFRIISGAEQIEDGCNLGRFQHCGGGGLLISPTARPPVVRRAGGGTADATSQDAWTGTERWRGEWRGGCFLRRELERRAEVGRLDLSRL